MQNYVIIYVFTYLTRALICNQGRGIIIIQNLTEPERGVPIPLKILIHILFKNLSCELLLLIWMCHILQKQKIELWHREKSGIMLIKMAGVQMIFTILFVMFCII